MKVRKIKSRKIYINTCYAICFMVIGWFLNSRFSWHGDGAWMMQTPTVKVQNLVKKDVSFKKKYIAQVESINSVDIIPQVSGYVEQVLFKNGAEVKKGDLLFIIEQRRYKDNLKATEASAKQAKADYNRLLQLHQSKVVSDKALDIAESTFKNAEAAEDLARLNLEYTEVKSPIDGVIGKALITEGNLVNANSQKLAHIVQTKPVRIAFSVTDKERSEFLNKLNSSEDVYIDIVLPNGDTVTETVQNLFFENEVNPDTATIPVYLDFSNEDELLVSGNYTDIYIRFVTEQKSLLVPQVALSEDANGTYVMVVTQKAETYIVKQKYIKLGDVIDDMQIVLSGLDDNEQVIVQGLQKVRDNAEVNPIFVDVK